MMKKYRVHFETMASVSVDVELSDEEFEDADGDAVEIAIERAYEELPGDVCAQCSGWGTKWSRDQGEWEVAKERRVIDGETRLVEIKPELIKDDE
jgi:hypothetical protein